MHFNGGNSYLYISKIESFQFKRHDDIGQYEFCLGIVTKDFTKDEKKRNLLKWCSERLMIENNIK